MRAGSVSLSNVRFRKFHVIAMMDTCLGYHKRRKLRANLVPTDVELLLIHHGRALELIAWTETFPRF
jgi:hypothetical protein